MLTVDKEHFSEGAMRQAFKASDSEYKVDLVAKLHKKANLNKNFAFLKSELTALILAQFFLTEFNQRILFTMDRKDLVKLYIYVIFIDLFLNKPP